MINLDKCGSHYYNFIYLFFIYLFFPSVIILNYTGRI